jgi:hypothetical protein
MGEFQISNRIPSQYQTKTKYPRAMPPIGSKLPPVHSFKPVNGKASFGPSPRLRAVRFKPLNPHEDIEEAEEGTEWSGVENLLIAELGALLNKSVPEPDAQPEKPTGSGTFGIPFDKLTAASESRSKFSSAFEQAARWQRKKGGKSTYETKVTEQGDVVVTRREPKQSVKFQAWQAEKGKRLQVGFNKVRRVLLWERKTGTNYLTDKAKDELLTPGKQVPNDQAAAVVAGVRGPYQAVPVFALPEVPNGQMALPLNDSLAAAVLVPSAIDALFAGNAYAAILSEKETAKNDLNFKGAAKRFAADPDGATSQDAEGFLKFMEAAEKVFTPTQENDSLEKAAQGRVIRSPGSVPLHGALAGIEIANTVTTVAPWASVTLAPITVGLGVAEVYEGKHEFLRRVDQKAQAKRCKENMKGVLETASKEHPDYALAEGLVACFNVQQDRLIRQAKREKKFARIRILKGGGAIGGAVGAAAAVGTMAAFGVLTALTAGAAAIAPALWAAFGTGAMAMRNDLRDRAEHSSKWRQRMAQVVALEMSRKELQAKLIGTAKDGSPVDTRIHFELEEGEYKPKKGHFAGKHEKTLEARNNEYLGLRVLALKVRDMVETGEYDATSPAMMLAHAIGIDPLYLLAICKAANPKKPEEQLDFIQSKLGLKLGIKLRMAGATQAPPHVSVFLRHFDVAWGKAFQKDKTGLVPHSAGLYPEIRNQLAKLYPDSKAGMQAFDSAIGTFLKKTEQLPETEFRTFLKGFAEYLRSPQAVSDMARNKFKGLVSKKFSSGMRAIEGLEQMQLAATKIKAGNSQQAMEHAADLVEEMERFHRMEQADATTSTRACLPRAR